MRRIGYEKVGNVLIVAMVSLCSAGCTSTAPCLEYKATNQSRLISMRGYGTVRVEEQVMTCVHRYEPLVSARAAQETPSG